MTAYMDLLGKSPEEIDRELLNSHKKVLEFIELYKKGELDWSDLKPMQEALMDSTGYLTKRVNYARKFVNAGFEDSIVPSNPLRGQGINELEAICNACENLFDSPSNYNTFSIKYVDQLKNSK
jgi:hypothetical protein